MAQGSNPVKTQKSEPPVWAGHPKLTRERPVSSFKKLVQRAKSKAQSHNSKLKTWQLFKFEVLIPKSETNPSNKIQKTKAAS
jgi:hypothetical protein